MCTCEYQKQAGAELGQAQVKLEVIVEVGVEDRWIYFVPSKFLTFPVGGWVAVWWLVGVENEINANSAFN